MHLCTHSHAGSTVLSGTSVMMAGLQGGAKKKDFSAG